jgi:hypothetical protein
VILPYQTEYLDWPIFDIAVYFFHRKVSDNHVVEANNFIQANIKRGRKRIIDERL